MLARFLDNTRGGVAPIAAVVALPLMVGVGVAMDYSKVNAARSAFQVALLDSTALMLSKDAAIVAKDELQTEATAKFNALFSHPDVVPASVQVTPVYTTSGGSKLTMTGTATVNTSFISVIASTVNISATSVSTWGNTRLRVALVLDNTGSMTSDDKINALKTASHTLLSQLNAAAVHPEDVYVSIVPFVKDVNVGSSNYNQPWVRWDLWEEVNGKCSNTTYKNKTNCVSHSKVWTARPTTIPGTAASPDRDQNFDTTNDAPSTGGTLYPAEQYSSCPAATVMGLSNNWDALNAKIDTMTANGNANQAIRIAARLADPDGLAIHGAADR